MVPDGEHKTVGVDLSGGGSLTPDAVARAYDERSEEAEPVIASFSLKKPINKRLDKYLADRIPYMSRSALQRLISTGGVTINGKNAKPSTVVHQGDDIVVHLPPPPSKDIPAEDIPLDVLYEDDHFIVINKQANLIVHPARSEKSGTLINALAFHFQNRSSGRLSTVGEEYARPGVVHRLDRHTTGAMVAAKSEEAHWLLGRQFENRTPDKRYIAVVEGELDPPADIIDLPLGPHPRRDKGYREKYVVRHDDTGKPSVTIYRVLEYYRGYTLVELELKTGRTHQIRVHLSYLNHPLVGDDMYGGKILTPADLDCDPETLPADLEPDRGMVLDRQALHAAYLSITHPITGQPMTFHAPLPPDMARLVRLLRLCRGPARRLAIQGTKTDLDTLSGINNTSKEKA